MENNFLKVLDESAINYDFPMLDNENIPMIACKLSLYSDTIEWILFIEILSIRQSVENNVYAYGSNIDFQGLQFCYDDYLKVYSNGQILGLGELIKKEIEGKNLKICINKRKNIDLSAQYMSFNKLDENYLLRSIYEEHSEEFWLDKEELFKTISKPILGLLFETEAWEHPDIANEKLPSTSPFFQSLAKKLKNPDVTVALGDINTHWLNWYFKREQQVQNGLFEEQEVSLNQLKDKYHLVRIKKACYLTFSSMVDRSSLVYKQYKDSIINGFILNELDEAEEDLVELGINFSKKGGIICIPEVDEDVIELFEIDADQGGLRYIFINEAGVYDENEQLIEMLVGGKCFIWEIYGDGAFLVEW
ncbi:MULTISPECIES: hypothetical protein [unclassified Listeria]|uniref:DUF7003 family protein n=1 Tax=unclassified Listeria TaxID=2642072 RepID=UPI000B59391E|nr:MULTISPECIES: hypothetical protein [unclassified Listeria]